MGETMRDILAVTAITIFVMLICAIGTAGGVWLANKWEQKACAEQAAQMGFPHSYSFKTGCMIRPASGWVPLANYRAL